MDTLSSSLIKSSDRADHKPLLSILIVSYNTREMTLECIRSVFSETAGFDFEIIVLDNSSKDGSAEAIEAEFEGQITLIRSQDNLGFAGGNNHAVALANGDYLLLLNPDTVVLDNAIGKLLQNAESHAEAKIWGGRTLFGDLSLNPASCWAKQTVWSLFSQASGLSSLFRKSTLLNPEGIGGWNRDGNRHVDIVSGCFLLIRKELWDELNGFHPDFFMYGEEADLCLRAKKLGADPIVFSDATIIHYGGASDTVRIEKMVKLLKAKALLIERHFSPATAWIGLNLLLLWPFSRLLMHSLVSLGYRQPYLEKRNVWQAIWQKRKTWLSGY